MPFFEDTAWFLNEEVPDKELKHAVVKCTCKTCPLSEDYAFDVQTKE